MKLKMIASLFSRYKQLALYSAPGGEQWIGNGAAIYSLRGMPRLTPEIVLRVFDVPPDKHDKWICREDSLPAAIQFTDSASGETSIEPLKTSIGWFGNSYWLFPDGRSIYSVNGDYIKPLLDEPDYLTFHKRETDSGSCALACKIGLELKAIIAPSYLHGDARHAEEIQLIARLSKSMGLGRGLGAAREIFGEQAAAPAPEAGPEAGDAEAEGAENG